MISDFRFQISDFGWPNLLVRFFLNPLLLNMQPTDVSLAATDGSYVQTDQAGASPIHPLAPMEEALAYTNKALAPTDQAGASPFHLLAPTEEANVRFYSKNSIFILFLNQTKNHLLWQNMITCPGKMQKK